MANPFAIQTSIAGSGDVVLRLQNVSKQVRNKLLRKAVTKAVQPVTKQAKANAKNVTSQATSDDLLGQVMKSTGLFAKAIGSKVKTYPSGVVVGIIGARSGFNRVVGVRVRGKNIGKAINADPIYYGHLVEFGTHRSRAKPVMRPAWDQKKDEASATLHQVLGDGIEEAAKK